MFSIIRITASLQYATNRVNNKVFEYCKEVWLVAVWCSSNALVLINAVVLHRARLVLGWVTAFGWVNYLTT